VLFRPSESGCLLYVVLQGKVKLSLLCEGRRANALEIAGPGEQFGELSLLDVDSRLMLARALTDAQVATVTSQRVNQWIATHPDAAVRMLQVLARRLRHANLATSDLIFVDVAGRVAKQLILLVRKFGSSETGQLRVAHDLTQSDLAQLAAASRKRVNMELSNFAERGWLVLERKRVLLLAPDQLARRAGVSVDIIPSRLSAERVGGSVAMSSIDHLNG
jgi:CRP/FNR family cyclic AMP-dependent transcriptional regulator